MLLLLLGLRQTPIQPATESFLALLLIKRTTSPANATFSQISRNQLIEQILQQQGVVVRFAENSREDYDSFNNAAGQRKTLLSPITFIDEAIWRVKVIQQRRLRSSRRSALSIAAPQFREVCAQHGVANKYL